MERIYWKGSALLAPVPSVMVSCGTEEKPNIITIGWCGIVSSKPPKLYISVRPERHSYDIIDKSGEFVVNLVPDYMTEICDYVGTVTGKCVDKVSKTGLTMIPSKTVSAPTIADCPAALECKVTEKISLGSHDMFIAEITQVSVTEDLVDSSGKLRMDKVNLINYIHGEYFARGRKLGKIGMSMENRKKGKRATMEVALKRKKVKER